MTIPTSITHPFGFWTLRFYLKYLFSVLFDVALPLTVKKDIVSFDSHMQYYSKFVGIHRFRVLQSRGLSGEQPTRLRILWGESPHAVNYLYQAASIFGACGGNEARSART